MRKRRLLDLFACAGGIGVGYARAGFDVVGVDIRPQPRNPHRLIVADCMALDLDFIRTFDAVHASPPCQGYSAMRHAPGAKGAPRMIGPVRDLLQRAGVPYVIENVEAAAWDMRAPVRLCGSMFGLGAQGHQLRRHREFECSFPVSQPACNHTTEPVIGVFGGHARRRSAKHGGRGTRDVWVGGHKAAASEAMGISWMSLSEMSEAVPPAYGEFIGGKLMGFLDRMLRAA